VHATCRKRGDDASRSRVRASRRARRASDRPTSWAGPPLI